MARCSLVVVALALAGCGAPGEGKNVKDALTQFASDRSRGDAEAVCAGITPESRRLMETLGRGVEGPDGDCETSMEQQLGEAGPGGLSATDVEAIDTADVDIDGDRARIKGQGDDRRLPMRKVDGEWLVDLGAVPGEGYALRVASACTESNLRALAAPLPKPTRAGIAGEATRDAEALERIARTLERAEPPKGNDAERDRIVEGLRASAKEWRRAASALRGFGGPLDTYNKALKTTTRRLERLEGDQRTLSIGCFGRVDTRADAADYRRRAQRICRGALRRLDRIAKVDPAAIGSRGAALGRATAAKLRRLDAPEGMERIHRRSADALAATYDELPRLIESGGSERAEERFGLLALRHASGFLRIGLDRCGQL
jgi:hypothetical protein